MYVFGLWQEVGTPGENPRRCEESMQTPNRETLEPFIQLETRPRKRHQMCVPFIFIYQNDGDVEIGPSDTSTAALESRPTTSLAVRTPEQLAGARNPPNTDGVEPPPRIIPVHTLLSGWFMRLWSSFSFGPLPSPGIRGLFLLECNQKKKKKGVKKASHEQLQDAVTGGEGEGGELSHLRSQLSASSTLSGRGLLAVSGRARARPAASTAEAPKMA